jgi:cobalamin-dependent methionine synthase I
MPTLRDIPIHLTSDQVLAAQKQGRRKRNSSSMQAAAQKALDLAQSLYRPGIVYQFIPVQRMGDESIILAPHNGREEGHRLKVGQHADLLASATHVIAAVCTLGPALEEQVNQLNQEGDLLTAYWLDTVGVMALGAVGETVRCMAEEQALERGWGVSPALSPGSLVGWSMRGQKELCALLPLQEIGVQLNKNNVLEPHKSVSVVIGIGPDYQSHKVGSVCHLCALADTCWRRK